jgi:glucokinase
MIFMNNASNARYPLLLADIGGTNARFAIETAPGTLQAVSVFPVPPTPV